MKIIFNLNNRVDELHPMTFHDIIKILFQYKNKNKNNMNHPIFKRGYFDMWITEMMTYGSDKLF